MANKLKVKAVVFDRDGVIIDTEGVVIDSITKAFAQLGFTVGEEDFQHTIGRSSTDYKDYFLSKWDFDYDEYLALQRDLFYRNLDAAEYFQDTIELIKKLHSQNIPIAVTTSAGRDGTKLILEKIGIFELFNVVTTREDCDKHKPDPEPYLTTTQKLGLAPNLCVAIEDTALGVQAAKAAGLYCIAIPNQYTRDQDFSLADAVLSSAAEVENLLEFI